MNYGRLLTNVRLQDMQFQQFVASYQNAILNANQDAENSMVAYLKSLDQAKYLKDSAEASAKLTDYLVKQFEKGYLPPGAADTSAFINQLFTAINFQVTQQDAAAQAEGNIALNLILLYRALGGGWQIRLPQGENYLQSHDGCPTASPPPYWPRKQGGQEAAPLRMNEEARFTMPVLLPPLCSAGIAQGGNKRIWRREEFSKELQGSLWFDLL